MELRDAVMKLLIKTYAQMVHPIPSSRLAIQTAMVLLSIISIFLRELCLVEIRVVEDFGFWKTVCWITCFYRIVGRIESVWIS